MHDHYCFTRERGCPRIARLVVQTRLWSCPTMQGMHYLPVRQVPAARQPLQELARVTVGNE